MGVIFFSVLFAVAYGVNITTEVKQAFADFQSEYDKSYETQEEYLKRLTIFAENMEKVERQNREHVAIGGEEVFGVTKFMDLSAVEFKQMYLTAKPNNIPDHARVTPDLSKPQALDIDWRTKGVITSIKDQGQCGSCWAFSAVDAIESYGVLNGNYTLTKLSAQQVNACDKVDDGCNGGNTESAYEYVHKAGGIETALAYPYTSGGGRTGICKFDKSKVAYKITGYKSIKKGEDNVHAAMSDGPLSVCVAAESFQTYNRGILKICLGGIDHCVQAVGYDDTDNYWLVRNSWGQSWGEEGYIRLEQGKNICKIGNDATYPTF